MIKYSCEMIVPYYDTNIYGVVRPTSILAYMGEVSNLQSDYLGVGIKELIGHNVGWMLNRWRVKFLKYPIAQDKIRIETWCSGIDRFYALREFAVYDANNEKIVMATTQWIFLDTLKKRPKRVPQELKDIYGAIDEKHFDDFYDFRLDFDTNIETGENFHVRKSDIDYNKHVNNVKYLNWILEIIPSEMDENYLLNELEILYKKEIKYGELINSSFVNSDKDNTYLHKITNGQEINAFGKTIWKKK